MTSLIPILENQAEPLPASPLSPTPQIPPQPLSGIAQTAISWDTIVNTRKLVPTMNWIPCTDRAEISRVFAVYLKRVNCARSPAEHSLAMKYLYALPTALLRRSGRKDPSRRNRRSLSLALRERCRKALNWELPGLLKEATEAFSVEKTTPTPRLLPDDDKSKYRRARASAEKGEYRRAIAALESAPLANTADAAVQAELKLLHPTPAQPINPVPHIESLPPAPQISQSDVIGAIRRFDRTSAAGPDGLYPSILQALVKNSEGEDPIYNFTAELTKFLQKFLSGKLPIDSARYLCGAQLTALRKPNGTIRPIACGIVYRRLASRLAMQTLKDDADLHGYLEPHQISVGTSGGLEAGIHALRHTIDALGASKEYVLLSLDFSNAFNKCSRQAFLDACQTHTPTLARYIHYAYGNPTFLHTREQVYLSQEGTQQGDPLGMLLFSLVAQPLILNIQATFKPLLNVWMADDGNFIARIEDALKIYNYVKTKGPSLGLHMQQEKTKVWWPNMSSHLLKHFDCKVLWDNRRNPAEGLTLFGAAFGSPSYIRMHFNSSVSKTNHILGLLKEMKRPQLSFQLQRYCASTCRVSHLLRCTPPGLLKNSVSTLDTISREGFDAIHEIHLGGIVVKKTPAEQSDICRVAGSTPARVDQSGVFLAFFPHGFPRFFQGAED